jgi:hypothetical protein
MLTELIAGMRPESIHLGELLGHPSGEVGIKATATVDGGQLVEFRVRISPVFQALGPKIDEFHISLGTHRHVLAHRHGHRSRGERSKPRGEHSAV